MVSERLLRDTGYCVRLFHIGAELRKDFVEADSCRDREAKFKGDCPPDLVRYFKAVPHCATSGNVQPTLIHAIRFNQIGISSVDFPRLSGELHVLFVVGFDNRQVRAFLLCLPDCLPGRDPEGFCCVVFGENNPMSFFYRSADCHGFVAKAGVEHTFDAGVEVIHVTMKNCS